MSGRIRSAKGQPQSHVALWLSGGKAPVEPLESVVLDQKNKVFSPHVLVVPRGTTVTFPNSDALLHNVYAQFEAKRFDLGLYPRGQSKKQRFDREGVVVVRCNIHAQMSAYIVVVDSPYYAVTDSQGRFRIPQVPPGSYTLHLWHESGARDQQTLVVEPGMEPLERGFSRS